MKNDIETKAKTDEVPNFEGLNAEEIWKVLYGKALNTKKNILEYIELTKVLRKSGASSEQLQDTYNFIFNSIDAMGSTIKVNTNYYLKTQLKTALGKYVNELDPRPVNHFIEFFKEAYPPNTRRKDFTWVLTDINKIANEQIWTTLAYINSWCLKEENSLDEAQKKDIIKMVELLVSRRDIRYINRLRSLEKLVNSLDIKIVTGKDGFKVKKNK
ncbi:hypothetical protein [Clostridium thermarum]|uniref:hypothetical protein n=1 Tax=Clostridium thermarum TaxID=1716543 RepID=UPI0013D30218|nr:hypothetical protein [Clostridium thermarum]